MNIFKVFYQNHKTQRIIREETLSVYIEAKNIEQVRKYFADKEVTLEHIEALSPDHLAYEKEHNENFEVIKLDE
ncbi:RNA polymerase epsilon subunit [Nosocomiicoccus ampullae]|uniref:DNA-dependent RNA polymerase auxiliary subunit epsilon n=1 Tax=Nosocomiicoccus ampullae TaxID=489910 RepID=A0A9Q2HFP4_9STAP|nr:RNA polymerase epsilon subunit [Nosocomiicoccus ampullae]MBB5176111.1 DNA-dependent RNA polymerase auxiliary subunit epsilon [Nosocomiicoccus ampullae]QYA47284.1 DNA-dependent RNA polymerase auxiliary subunit epsilon family protein [Nosocomiicoccus ampullae]QYA48913.1 DNA-dependent RNA polymerase auxiliary subunit epsilon family protein [Nosocomiicoccus ampullae]HJB78737.1 DNA-dependent RNA polymerase auxiliary subunit epsilon family protein [Candidatus Nosocomiicoccus stercorigallinarum]